MKKRIIASILTVIMLMTMLQTAALAADGEGTEAVASTTPQAAIYLDQQHGADSNDGLTKESAVQSIVKANELAESNHTNDIYLTSFYKITGAEVWDLGGKTIHRYGLGGYMIELVNASASLTLSNVVIDGAEYTVEATHAAETDSIIKAANGGTIVLKSGAVLQNNKAAQFGSSILANNGVNITMEDGAIIRNNTNRNYELGGGILIGNGSTFTMNGGEISGNTANGGGGVAIIGSTMVMNDGTISNNSTYRTSGQGSYGAGVYVADYANSSGGDTVFTAKPASFEMNGGKITGNTALDYGGGVLTFPQQGQKITININNGEISGNQVTEGSGGAFAAFFGVTELNIKGGTLSGNSAQNYGGGVFLYGKGDSFYMTDGIISDNGAKQGGGISISDTDAAAYLLGGTIQDNKAIDGYPHVDDASERSYYGNAVYQDGSLYLDGTKANISGDIRIGCRFDTSGGISTNRFVALVGASDTMNDYELTSFESESLDGRVVVAPSAITYGTEAYSVADAEPYLAHFTHNHKEIITDTDYTAETGASSQAKSLVLYGAIQKYSVTYTDGIGGASFADEVTSDLRRGTPTPAFTGGTPTHSGYTFTGWSPAVAATVTANAVYTAQWVPIGGGGEDPYGNLTVSKTVTGKAGDTEQKFTFTVKLDRAISGAYGDMTFNNGTAVVTLKHGESSTATKLPADIHYTVTESDNDGYTVTANGATGVISDGKTAVAAFINTKDSDAPDQPSNPDSPVTPNQPGSPDVPNDSGTPDDVPKMGDTMNLGLWISLMGLSLAGLFISLVVVKKRTRRNRHSN